MSRTRSVLSSVESLQAAGFRGFVAIRQLRATNLTDVPEEMGVYLVLRPSLEPLAFLQKSTGGHFKRKDPTVTTEFLQANQVDDALVVYVGKAGAPGGSATLRSRLRQFLAFGAGQAIGHWGGRLIWQVANAEDLVVCWIPTPGEVPRAVEARIIAQFKASHGGRRPLANLQD